MKARMPSSNTTGQKTLVSTFYDCPEEFEKEQPVNSSEKSSSAVLPVFPFASMSIPSKEIDDVIESLPDIEQPPQLLILENLGKASYMEASFMNSNKFKMISDSIKEKITKFVKRNYTSTEKHQSVSSYHEFFSGAVESYFMMQYDKTHDVHCSNIGENETAQIRLMQPVQNYSVESIWEIEKPYHSENVDYSKIHNRPNSCLDMIEDITLNYSRSSRGNKINYKLLVDNCADYVIRDFIAYKMMGKQDDDINVKIVKDIKDAELIYIMRQIMLVLCAEVEKIVYHKLATINHDKFFTEEYGKSSDFSKKKSSFLARKEGFSKGIEDMKRVQKELEKSEKKMAEKDAEIARLKQMLEKAGLEAEKAEKAEINAVKTELKKERERNIELSARIDRLNDFISLLQNTTEESEASVQEQPRNLMEELEEVAKDFKDKKIVFVRSNKSVNYLIMKDLEKFFPNAKFTNGVASGIDTGKTDIVCLLTKYTEHCTYYGARDTAKAAGVKCVHCEYSRLEGIVKTIADALKR